MGDALSFENVDINKKIITCSYRVHGENSRLEALGDWHRMTNIYNLYMYNGGRRIATYIQAKCTATHIFYLCLAIVFGEVAKRRHQRPRNILCSLTPSASLSILSSNDQVTWSTYCSCFPMSNVCFSYCQNMPKQWHHVKSITLLNSTLPRSTGGGDSLGLKFVSRFMFHLRSPLWSTPHWPNTVICRYDVTFNMIIG